MQTVEIGAVVYSEQHSFAVDHEGRDQVARSGGDKRESAASVVAIAGEEAHALALPLKLSCLLHESNFSKPGLSCRAWDAGFERRCAAYKPGEGYCRMHGAPHRAASEGRPVRPWRLGQSHFLLGLIALGLITPTEGLQERRCLGILHRLVLCAGVLCGRDLYPCILLPPDLFSGVSYLFPRAMDRPDIPVLLHRPAMCSGIFRNLCRGILNGLYGPDLWVRIFLGRPSLEFPKQGIRR